GAVPDRSAAVGPGQQGITGEAQRAPDTHDARARGGPEPGRYPEGMTLGQGTQASAGPARRTPGRTGHERVGQPHLTAQVDRLRAATEKAVGPEVHDAAPDLFALEGAT